MFRTLQACPSSCVAVITRPPEIVACFKIPISQQNAFVIYDSRSRPAYPHGAGFILNTSIDATAARLSEILPPNNHLLSDRNLQWQAQLLANFTGHVYVSTNVDSSPDEMIHAIIGSSLEILALRAEHADLKSQNSSLLSENHRLEAEIEDLEVNRREDRRRSAQLGMAQKSHQRHPNPRSSATTNAVAGPSRPQNVPAAPQQPHGKSLTRGLGPPKGNGKLPKADPRRNEQYPSFQTPHFDYTVQLQLGGPAFHSNMNQESAALVAPQQRYDGEDLRLRSQKEALTQMDLRHNQRSPASQSFDDDDFDYAVQLQLGTSAFDVDKDQESAAFAAQQQQQYDEENFRLLSQKEALSQYSQQLFQCGVCMEDHPTDDVASFKPCGHEFCRDCIRSYVVLKLGERQFPIMCPTCMAGKGKGNEDPGGTHNYHKHKTILMSDLVVSQSFVHLIGITGDQYNIWEEMEMAAFSVPLLCRG